MLSSKVKSAKVILYNDLGPEAIYKLEVKDFPLLVGIDSEGRDVYPPSSRHRRDCGEIIQNDYGGFNDKAGWKKE